MNEKLGKHFDQVEIADLIEESVANAALRRQQVMEDSLVDISEEEAKNIEGGLSVYPIKTIFPPIILGLIWEPIINF